MADCGTTLGHDADGTPILDREHLPAEQRRQIGEVQAGVLRWTRAWAAHRAAHRIGETASLMPIYRAICLRSAARPFEVELELFADWVHDENFGSAGTRTLAEVEGADAWERGHMSAHQVASLPPSRVYWPFGFARRLSPAMGETVANIFLRTAPPRAFDSGHPPRTLAFFWDQGAGFNARDAVIEEVALNNRGRVWYRRGFRLERATHRMYGFSPAAAGEVLQLTGIRVHARPRDGEPFTLDFPHEAVDKAQCTHLHDNLYRVDADPPILAVPVEGIVDFTGIVEVDLFFGVLPAA
jgi:hypothetical protein